MVQRAWRKRERKGGREREKGKERGERGREDLGREPLYEALRARPESWLVFWTQTALISSAGWKSANEGRGRPRGQL